MFFHKKDHQELSGSRGGHKPVKHMALMGVCCILPIIIIAILPFFSLSNIGAGIFLSGLSILICPIMMGAMMFFMFRGNSSGNMHKNCHGNGEIEKKD